MKTSAAGVDFIKAEESFCPNVYKDFAGKDTIGYGHLIKPGEKFTTISEADATMLMITDLAHFEGYVNRLVKVPLTQRQFDSLVSFAYNAGAGAFETSTLLKMLNLGDMAGAAVEFVRWVYYTKSNQKLVSETLLKRRRKEMTMFLRGILDKS